MAPNTVSMSPAWKAFRNCSVMSTSAWLTGLSFSLERSLSRHQQHGGGDGAAAHTGQGDLGSRHLPVAAFAPQLLHRFGQLAETMEAAAAEVAAVGADGEVAAEAAPALGEPRAGFAFLHEPEVLQPAQRHGREPVVELGHVDVG